MILAALAFGFLGSLHCVGMCGPLVLSMPFDVQRKGSVSRILSYHSGRILTYSFLGLIAGMLGDALRFFFVQQWISIAAGVLLLTFYFLPQIINRFTTPSFSKIWNQKVVNKMKQLLLGNKEQATSTRLFSLGLINGLLPCGLVYMALLGAISQPSILYSVLFMMIFGLGTSPALSSIIISKKWLLKNGRSFYTKFAPVFIVAISVLLILRGLGLGIPFISPAGEMPACHSASISIFGTCYKLIC